jgi:hypothetical protein
MIIITACHLRQRLNMSITITWNSPFTDRHVNVTAKLLVEIIQISTNEPERTKLNVRLYERGTGHCI